ncbi:MAG: hypothetical protein Q8O25_11280, partial [Sulfurisoma sp.]|nr:hypothetical protein [Sulfurisoma sp.]
MESPGNIYRKEVALPPTAFVGDALADAPFLNLVAEKNPAKFAQFARIAIDWLKSVANRLMNSGFGSSQYFRDVEYLRDRLVAHLTLYSDLKVGDGEVFDSRQGLWYYSAPEADAPRLLHMNCVSRGTPRIGQMTVELALDGSRIRRMPDKRRALAQRGKPGVPVPDKAFPDRVVVAVARTGANQLQRRNFPIAQRRRKSPSAQPRLHNDFA